MCSALTPDIFDWIEGTLDAHFSIVLYHILFADVSPKTTRDLVVSEFTQRIKNADNEMWDDGTITSLELSHESNQVKNTDKRLRDEKERLVYQTASSG